MSAKVCYITAIYGSYEICTKVHAEQTVKADFICFTNNKNLVANNWIVDYTPYHILYKSEIDDNNYNNSLTNNTHNFNVAKYYKQQFYRIPRLKQYDIIIWLDGTIEIYNSEATAILAKKMESEKIITFEHKFCYGRLECEMQLSLEQPDKYTSTFWLGQSQPIQDVNKQYQDYLQDGYDEDYFKRQDPTRIHLGVYVTCVLAFHNNEETRNFLDYWYLQTLKYTTNDQIGFPYVAQKLNIIPRALPDADIKGDYVTSDIHRKWYHGLP
jgi:hypothetical protein